MTLAWRVVEYQFHHYRRTWRSTMAATILFPALLLLVLGVGVGQLVDNSGALGSVRYLEFLAPAVIAGTAMQVGVAESTLPVFASLNLTRTADAALATPIGPVGLINGYLLWIGLRTGAGFLVVFALALAVGAVPVSSGAGMLGASVLVALAHAGPLLAFTVRQNTAYGLAALTRLVVLPTLLGAGTLAPTGLMPGALALVARLTPLWHGVQLCRWYAGVQALSAWAACAHIAYLSAWTGAGYLVARRSFHHRLAAR
jgi:lipooligosaccharide transport system permease protein